MGTKRELKVVTWKWNGMQNSSTITSSSPTVNDNQPIIKKSENCNRIVKLSKQNRIKFKYTKLGIKFRQHQETMRTCSMDCDQRNYYLTIQ